MAVSVQRAERVTTLVPAPWFVIAVPALSGISGAVFRVLFSLSSDDLTLHDGRFNLCMGLLGLNVFVGAAESIAAAGWVADPFDDRRPFSARGRSGSRAPWRAASSCAKPGQCSRRTLERSLRDTEGSDIRSGSD